MFDDALSINNFDDFSCFSNSFLGVLRVSTDNEFGASKLGAKLREGPNIKLDARSADVLARFIARILANFSLMKDWFRVAVLLESVLGLANVVISMVFASSSNANLLPIAAMFRLFRAYNSAFWLAFVGAFLERTRNGGSYPASNVSARGELEAALLRLLVT